MFKDVTASSRSVSLLISNVIYATELLFGRLRVCMISGFLCSYEAIKEVLQRFCNDFVIDFVIQK